MICKVKKTIEKFSMLKDVDEVLVGFSGGADSTALIHVLYQLKNEYGFKLTAAHVNHCLRGDESDRDEKFVTEFCQDRSMEINVLKVDVKSEAQKNGKSIEEYAREIRYDFFSSLSGKNTAIATAHNLNDCEETLLFNLSRGSALKGLTSIPPVRENIIRPLIECSRDEIENYCRVNNLSYVTDSTNLTDDYTRNKIRHNVIPVLRDLNPSFDSAVLRCISSIRDDESYIKKQADILYNEIKKDFGFDAQKLNLADIALKRRVILRILHEKCAVLPESKHIELVESILLGGKAEVLCKETVVVRSGVLYFVSDLNSGNVKTEKIVFNNGVWKNARLKLELTSDYTQKFYKELALSTFDYDRIIGNLVLRKRQDGDKITLPVRKVTKSLKKLFNEMKIPPEERDNILVLSDDNGVIWVENIGADRRCKVTKETKNIIFVNVLGEN